MVLKKLSSNRRVERSEYLSGWVVCHQVVGGFWAAFGKHVFCATFFKKSCRSINKLVSERVQVVNRPQRLKGTTLVEALTSMTILAMVFVLAFQITDNMTGIHSPVQQFRTRQICRNMLYTPISKHTPAKEEQLIKGRRVVKTIESLEELYLITVSCYWGEELMVKRSRIMSKQAIVRSP